MTDDKIDTELKKDVTKLFEKHSANIVNVNDVFDMKEKLNIKVTYIEHENIYPKLFKSKKEAQLTLNLYNAYEFYEKFKVLNKCDLENSCKENFYNESCSRESGVDVKSSFTNSCEKMDNNSNSHHTDEFEKSESCSKDSCHDKPNQEKVIDKLSRYVFYFLIAKHLEVLEIFKSIPGNECLQNIKCTCCEAINEFDVWQCTICGDSLFSFYEANIKEHEEIDKKKFENVKVENEKLENRESVINKDLISGDNEEKTEPDSQVADNHDEKHLDWRKWECKKCGLVNGNENVNCIVCMEARTEWICKQCTLINEMTSEQCNVCGTYREDKVKNKDNNGEKEGMIDSWNCWYEKCKKRNDGNVKYCTDCGLDKSANRERGAAVDMKKSGEKQQVWICYACYHINNDLGRSLCDKCFEWKVDDKLGSNKDEINVDMKKSDEKLQMWTCGKCGHGNNDLSTFICQRCGVSKVDHKDKINEDAEILDSYEVIESSDNNDVNKWKCKQCKSVNGDELLLCCKQCKSSRLEIWICTQCTMRNQISDDNCAACGKENENKIIKNCSKCKRGEIIYDNLCRDCLRARYETWICWYRLCENKNIGNLNYCKHCGLDRDANKIDIGAPMLRCKGAVLHEIWICDKCFNINDISCSYCQHKISQYRTCFNKNKYTRSCYRCKYRYNHESNTFCKMCKEKLGWK